MLESTHEVPQPQYTQWRQSGNSSFKIEGSENESPEKRKKKILTQRRKTRLSAGLGDKRPNAAAKMARAMHTLFAPPLRNQPVVKEILQNGGLLKLSVRAKMLV